jgi:hypothetical protein
VSEFGVAPGKFLSAKGYFQQFSEASTVYSLPSRFWQLMETEELLVPSEQASE